MSPSECNALFNTQKLPCAKDHGAPKCQLVVPFKILHYIRPVLSTLVWNDFNIGAMDVFTMITPIGTQCLRGYTGEGVNLSRSMIRYPLIYLVQPYFAVFLNCSSGEVPARMF